MEKKTYLPPETVIVSFMDECPMMVNPSYMDQDSAGPEYSLGKSNDFFFEDFEDFDTSDEYDGVDEQHPFGSLFGSLWD